MKDRIVSARFVAEKSSASPPGADATRLAKALLATFTSPEHLVSGLVSDSSDL